MQAIGVIHSPFTDKRQTPIQPIRSQSTGTIEIYPEFSAGLKDLDGFSHIIILYVFHRSSGYNLLVKPFLDNQMRGLFSTRYPARPNPIGCSIVSLLKHRDNILEIGNIDVLDGTPLLDIKPYVPDFDIRTNVRSGWYDQRSKK